MIKMDSRVTLLLLLIVGVHLLFNQSLQLHYDEAYYWVWSKNLQLSYFDHPPMIAYLIRLTTLISDKEWFIRLVGVLCGTATILTLYKTSQWLFNQQAANIVVVLALAWPLLEGTFFIATIDSPLLLFWSLSLYCGVRGFIGNSRGYLYLTGVCLGLALLSKYTALLFAGGVLVFLIASPRQRWRLATPHCYLALLLALLVFSPVLLWNYQHNWVSFKFQFQHGIANQRQLNLASLADYLGSMLGAANPLISLPIFIFIWRKRQQIVSDDRYLMLVAIFVVVVAFFGYNSLYKFMEANWVAPAFISGIIFLAASLAEAKLVWVQRVAISLVVVLLPVVKAPQLLLPKAWQSKIPAINAFKGNAELYQQIKLNYWLPGEVVLACDYGNASRGWYYLGVGRVYVLPTFKYADSYADWNKGLAWPIKSALYYCDGNDASYMQALTPYFATIKPLGMVKYHDSFVNNKLYVYRLSN